MELDENREHQFDLLTAALIGAAVGAGLTLLVSRGPSAARLAAPLMRQAGRGARIAGVAGMGGARWAGDRAAEGARWAAPRARRGFKQAVERGEELIDRVPVDDMVEQMRDYMESARDAINNVVKDELDDLRKAVRKQRKRIGV